MLAPLTAPSREPTPGRDAPLGRPRPANAGRSGAQSLFALPNATTLRDTKPHSVRPRPDWDSAARYPYPPELLAPPLVHESSLRGFNFDAIYSTSPGFQNPTSRS